MLDTFGKVLSVGQMVLFHGTHNILKTGSIYVIDKIIKDPPGFSGSEMAYIGNDETPIHGNYLILVEHYSPPAIDYGKIADRIIALNNAKPRSPWREEIIAVLKESNK